MESLERKTRKGHREKNPEYTVRVAYGTEKLEHCIRNLMRAMSLREEKHAEDL